MPFIIFENKHIPNYMIKNILLLFILIINFSYSQRNKYFSKDKFAVTISAPAIVDPYEGTSIRLGLDIPYKDLLINLEYGHYIPGNWALKTDTNGFIINPTIKIKVDKNKNNFAEYIGIDYLYKNYSHGTFDTIKSNNFEIRKEYKISRVVNGIALKYYQRYNFNKFLFFDFHVGLGIRYIISKSNLTQEENGNILNDEFHGASQIHNEINRTGNFIRPSFYCGAKFGFNLF